MDGNAICPGMLGDDCSIGDSRFPSKAGLPQDYWSADLFCSRYRSLTFEEPVAQVLARH